MRVYAQHQLYHGFNVNNGTVEPLICARFVSIPCPKISLFSAIRKTVEAHNFFD